MKKVMFLILMAGYFAKADGNLQTGNTINVNVTAPKPCCAIPCKKKVFTKIVEKIVEKPVIVEKQVVKVIEKPVLVEKVVVRKLRRKNRVSLLGGVGPTKIQYSSPNTADLIRQPVGALMYQRSITDRFNLGIQLQTNETLLGSFGIDF